MVLREKNLKRVIRRFVLIAILISLIVLFSKDYLIENLKPPIMAYVNTHHVFLKTLIFISFITGSAILIFIVWLLEWGDRHQKSAVTRYISQMVCQNYYGNYRKTNVYRAIRTAISKFSKHDTQDDAEESKTGVSHAVRVVDPSRYAIKSRSEKILPKAIIDETINDGPYWTYHPNGKIALEANYKNKKLHGLYRTYYEDGTLHNERYYKDGLLDGIYKAFDEYGIPYFDSCYQNGKQEGITNLYFKNGALQFRDTYKNGKRIHRDTFSETGELKFSQDEDPA